MTVVQAIKELLIEQPFYGLFLMQLDKEESETYVETACVSMNGISSRLVINPNYWKTLDDKQQIALMLHEVNHVLFHHMFIEKELEIGADNHTIFNLAADLTVNQYAPGIKDDIWGWIDKYFPGITTTLEKNKGVKYYYEKLVEYCVTHGMVGRSSGSVGNSEALKEAEKRLKETESHDSWEEYNELDEAGKKLVQNQTEYQIKEAATQTQKNRGTIPGHFKELIDKLFKIEPPIFNWKAYFRRYLGYSSEAFIKKTRRKESNRFPDAAGLKIKFKQNVFVGIDTSGSVSQDELMDFFSEIHHIWKSGVGITIGECDAALQRVYKYKGKFEGEVTGRGGTAFEPLINYYNEHPEFSSMVLFTDGYAPTENLRPRKQLMWIITSNGHMGNKYPGYVLQIPNRR